MKFKFINLIFILSIFTLNPNNTLGFFGDNLGLDLYSTMDNGTYELQEKILNRESDGFLEDLNKEIYYYGYGSCLSNLKISDLKSLNDGDVGNYTKKVIEDCGNGDENSISTDQINDFIKAGNKIYENIKESSENKSKNLLKISQIGMYADGDTDNSPFDIIDDLEAIDDIVFEKDLVYPGEKYMDLDDLIDSKEKSSETLLSASVDLSNSEESDESDEDEDISNIACLITDDPLISQIQEIQEEKKEDDSSNNNDSGTGATSTGTTNNSISNYSPINDSGEFPCEGFFCIQIEFVIQNYDLLIGGKNFSIEGLIKKSNKHLKKFASTSLIQSKMTTNNFELGLKDLNLADIFYVGIQVSTKPAPILNLEGTSNKTGSGELTSGSLIKKYYANLGLDYNRANDLNMFKGTDYYQKNIQSINEQYASNVTDKNEDYLNYINKQKLKNNYISDSYVEQSLNFEQMDDFYNKFVELENFSNSLGDYSSNLNLIIKGMKKIPTSSN